MNQKGAQGGGLWNTNRPVISSDTQNLLKSITKKSQIRYSFNFIKI